MISHYHEAIFVHIPKCAGQSIETVFLDDLGLSWDCREPLLLREKYPSEPGPPRLAHLLARDYVGHQYISKELFDSYYKFSVVRNPWSRAVSLYKHIGGSIPFRYFVAEQLQKYLWDSIYWFVRPQVDFLVDHNGNVIVDEVLRFEHLSQEFARVKSRLFLRSELGHENVGQSFDGIWREGIRMLYGIIHSEEMPRKRPDWRSYYDSATRKSIEILYAEDIEKFGYDFN